MMTPAQAEKARRRRKTLLIVGASASVVVTGVVIAIDHFRPHLPGPSTVPAVDHSSPIPIGVPTEPELRQIFNDISELYGDDIAENVERVYRLETAHFKSGGYKNTAAAGIVPVGSIYPYGWNSLRGFWDDNVWARPLGIWHADNGWDYLQFNKVGGFYAVAELLKMRGNDPGRFHSNDPAKQAAYNAKINAIQIQYT